MNNEHRWYVARWRGLLPWRRYVVLRWDKRHGRFDFLDRVPFCERNAILDVFQMHRGRDAFGLPVFCERPHKNEELVAAR